MRTLAPADTIAAVASLAATISCTIWGMEFDTTTKVEDYKVLVQSQLAAAAATIYTAPAGKQGLIRDMSFVNTDTASARSFQLFRGGTAAVNQFTPTITIPAGGLAEYGEGGWKIYDSTGRVLTSIFTPSPETNYGMAGTKAETIPRILCDEANSAALVSGTLALQAIWLPAGTVINSISLFSATTAAGTPTNYFFGLYDSSRNLLAQTANQTTAAWGANSLKTVNLTAPFTVSAAGLYYIGVFMTATTVPTLKGRVARTTNQLAAVAPTLQGASSTGLTTALPNPAAAITVSNNSFWAAVA